MWPGRSGRDLFAFGGGGARGAAHDGYVAPLWAAGIRPDAVWGCSVGALAGYCAAAHRPELFRSVLDDIESPKQVVRDRGPAAAFVQDGRYSLLPLVRDYIRPNARVADLEVPLYLSVCGLKSSGANLHRFRVDGGADESLHRWMHASSAIPVMMRPVYHGGEVWVDGGVQEVVPLRPALDEAESGDRVWAFVCRSPEAVAPWTPKQRHPSGLHILERYVDLALAEVIRGDIDPVMIEHHRQRGVAVRVLSTPRVHGGTLDFYQDNFSAWRGDCREVAESSLQTGDA